MSGRLCPQASVGAILQDPDGRFLVLYRKKSPRGLAFVSGHSEPGEEPELSLKREVLEEVGIEVNNSEFVLRQKFGNSCGRGFDSHEWWIYNIRKFNGEPRLCEPDKHDFVKFMTPAEIRSYIISNDVDPAWSRFIWPALAQFKHLLY